MAAEMAYMIGTRIEPLAEAEFLRSIADVDINDEELIASDIGRMADLVETYSDFPLEAADASLIAVAERLNQVRVATLDHRHFLAVRPAHVSSFELVP